MLKILKSSDSKTRTGKVGVGVSGSKTKRARSKLDGSKLNGNEVNGNEVESDEIGKKAQKRYKSQNLSKSKKTVGSDFFTPGAKLAFTKLKQVFFKALILYHFDPKRNIQIETDVLGYVNGRVLRQLTSNALGRWHLVAFFSQKMIPAETRYETHNSELLAIVETFKT